MTQKHVFLCFFNFEKEKKFQCEYKSEETQINFSKRSISKLCAIEELNILVSICDGFVKMHSLYDFQELETFSLKNVKRKKN
jgi:hypothetical protein